MLGSRPKAGIGGIQGSAGGWITLLGFVRFSLTLIELGILVPESLYPSCGIHKLLLACKQRMAVGADLHLDLLHGRSGFKLVPARTVNNGLVIGRMNILLHRFSFLDTPIKSPHSRHSRAGGRPHLLEFPRFPVSRE